MSESDEKRKSGWVLATVGALIFLAVPVLSVSAADPAPAIERGNALTGQGKLAEAEAAFREAIALDPKDVVAHTLLGSAIWSQGRLGEAIASYRRVTELAPENAIAHRNLGQTLVVLGEFEEAAAASRRAIGLTPDDAEAHNNLGAALAGQGMPREALESFRRALEIDPNHAKAHSNIGSALADLGNLKEASLAVRKGIELDPVNALSHSNLGDILQRTGMFSEAIESCKTAIRLDPKLARPHAVMGNAFRKLGKHDEAVLAFRRAIALGHDELGKLYNNIGFNLAALHRSEEALKAYREAAEHDAKNPRRWSTLAYANHALGMYEEAIRSCEKAIDLDPDCLEAHGNHGIALLMLGRFEEAEVSFGRAGHLAVRDLQTCLKLIRDESLIKGILREKGGDDPAAPPLLSGISEALEPCYPRPSAGAMQEYWEGHRREVEAALGTVEVRMISIRKSTGDPAKQAGDQALAKGIHAKLVAGADFAELARKHSAYWAKTGGLMGEIKRGALSEKLDGAAFSLEEGGVSAVIEDPISYTILKVDGRKPGKADSFDDPGVKEAVMRLLMEKRRAEWEKEYFARLVERVKSAR